MPATVKDVAELANVSPSSVSRYLNNPNSIKAKNAFRIKNAIDELNFIPNPVARSLKSGHSNLIGVVVPSMNSYFSQVCRAVSDFFYQHDYLVFFCESGEGGEKENYYLQEMLRLRFEGILLSAISSSSEDIKRIAKTSELVLVDRTVDADIDTIAEDNELWGEKLTEHILSSGHKKILGLFGSDKSRHAIQRLEGARKAADCHPDAELITQMNCYDHDYVYQVTQDALNMPEPPTAIITYGLTVTENTVIVLNHLNLRVPDDIFLACWALNDFRYRYRLEVPIIEENPYEMGITASDLLLKKIKNPGKKSRAKTHIFPVNFVK